MKLIELPSGHIINTDKIINMNLPSAGGKGWVKLCGEDSPLLLSEDDTRALRNALVNGRVFLK